MGLARVPCALRATLAAVVAVSLAACSSNIYLERYRVQTLDEERAILARHDSELADRVYEAKGKMQKTGGTPEDIVALTSSYHALAEKVGKGNNKEIYDYCGEAAGYELKIYKARGGGFTAPVLAELGRNLFLREEGGARKYLKKALELDPALESSYGKYLRELDRPAQ